MIGVFRGVAAFCLAGTATGLLLAAFMGSAAALVAFFGLALLMAALWGVRALTLWLRARPVVKAAAGLETGVGQRPWICRIVSADLGAVPALDERLGTLRGSGYGYPDLLVLIEADELRIFLPAYRSTVVAAMPLAGVSASMDRERDGFRTFDVLVLRPVRSHHLLRVRALAVPWLAGSNRATRELKDAVEGIGQNVRQSS